MPAPQTQILPILFLSVEILLSPPCGITCGAIDEPSRSSIAIDEREIINFRDKNVVIARFCNKNDVFNFYDMICHDSYDKNVMICHDISQYSVLSIAFLLSR